MRKTTLINLLCFAIQAKIFVESSGTNSDEYLDHDSRSSFVIESKENGRPRAIGENIYTRARRSMTFPKTATDIETTTREDNVTNDRDEADSARIGRKTKRCRPQLLGATRRLTTSKDDKPTVRSDTKKNSFVPSRRSKISSVGESPLTKASFEGRNETVVGTESSFLRRLRDDLKGKGRVYVFDDMDEKKDDDIDENDDNKRKSMSQDGKKYLCYCCKEKNFPMKEFSSLGDIAETSISRSGKRGNVDRQRWRLDEKSEGRALAPSLDHRLAQSRGKVPATVARLRGLRDENEGRAVFQRSTHREERNSDDDQEDATLGSPVMTSRGKRPSRLGVDRSIGVKSSLDRHRAPVVPQPTRKSPKSRPKSAFQRFDEYRSTSRGGKEGNRGALLESRPTVDDATSSFVGAPFASFNRERQDAGKGGLTYPSRYSSDRRLWWREKGSKFERCVRTYGRDACVVAAEMMGEEERQERDKKEKEKDDELRETKPAEGYVMTDDSDDYYSPALPRENSRTALRGVTPRPNEGDQYRSNIDSRVPGLATSGNPRGILKKDMRVTVTKGGDRDNYEEDGNDGEDGINENSYAEEPIPNPGVQNYRGDTGQDDKMIGEDYDFESSTNDGNDNECFYDYTDTLDQENDVEEFYDPRSTTDPDDDSTMMETLSSDSFERIGASTEQAGLNYYTDGITASIDEDINPEVYVTGIDTRYRDEDNLQEIVTSTVRMENKVGETREDVDPSQNDPNEIVTNTEKTAKKGKMERSDQLAELSSTEKGRTQKNVFNFSEQNDVENATHPNDDSTMESTYEEIVSTTAFSNTENFVGETREDVDPSHSDSSEIVTNIVQTIGKGKLAQTTRSLEHPSYKVEATTVGEVIVFEERNDTSEVVMIDDGRYESNSFVDEVTTSGTVEAIERIRDATDDSGVKEPASNHDESRTTFSEAMAVEDDPWIKLENRLEIHEASTTYASDFDDEIEDLRNESKSMDSSRQDSILRRSKINTNEKGLSKGIPPVCSNKSRNHYDGVRQSESEDQSQRTSTMNQVMNFVVGASKIDAIDSSLTTDGESTSMLFVNEETTGQPNDDKFESTIDPLDGLIGGIKEATTLDMIEEDSQTRSSIDEENTTFSDVTVTKKTDKIADEYDNNIINNKYESTTDPDTIGQTRSSNGDGVVLGKSKDESRTRTFNVDEEDFTTGNPMLECSDEFELTTDFSATRSTTFASNELTEFTKPTIETILLENEADYRTNSLAGVLTTTDDTISSVKSKKAKDECKNLAKNPTTQDEILGKIDDRFWEQSSIKDARRKATAGTDRTERLEKPDVGPDDAIVETTTETSVLSNEAKINSTEGVSMTEGPTKYLNDSTEWTSRDEISTRSRYGTTTIDRDSVDLPLAWNDTLLANAIKKVIKDLATNESVVSMARDSLVSQEDQDEDQRSSLPNSLSEIARIPGLDELLSMSNVQDNIVERAMQQLFKIVETPIRILEGEGRVKENIRRVLSDVLGGSRDAKPPLPPFTAEEHRYQNGRWITKMVDLLASPSPREFEGIKNDSEGGTRDTFDHNVGLSVTEGNVDRMVTSASFGRNDLALGDAANTGTTMKDECVSEDSSGSKDSNMPYSDSDDTEMARDSLDSLFEASTNARIEPNSSDATNSSVTDDAKVGNAVTEAANFPKDTTIFDSDRYEVEVTEETLNSLSKTAEGNTRKDSTAILHRHSFVTENANVGETRKDAMNVPENSSIPNSNSDDNDDDVATKTIDLPSENEEEKGEFSSRFGGNSCDLPRENPSMINVGNIADDATFKLDEGSLDADGTGNNVESYREEIDDSFEKRRNTTATTTMSNPIESSTDPSVLEGTKIDDPKSESIGASTEEGRRTTLSQEEARSTLEDRRSNRVEDEISEPMVSRYREEDDDEEEEEEKKGKKKGREDNFETGSPEMAGKVIENIRKKSNETSDDRDDGSDFLMKKISEPMVSRSRGEDEEEEEEEEEENKKEKKEREDKDEEQIMEKTTIGGEEESESIESDVVSEEEDFAYLGRISKGDEDSTTSAALKDLSEMEKSGLYYVGDDARLPLEIKRRKDGSYALSISKKICERIVENRKCPCCVPRDGRVAHSVNKKMSTDLEKSEDANENENEDDRGTEINANRRQDETIERFGSKCRKRKNKSDRRKRSNGRKKPRNGDDRGVEIFSMPVTDFVAKYNLSLMLEEGEEDSYERVGRSRDATDGSRRIEPPKSKDRNGQSSKPVEPVERGYLTSNPIVRRIMFVRGMREARDPRKNRHDIVEEATNLDRPRITKEFLD